MAGRGRASSQKRQKEMARLEKRQQKAQRKQERKLGPKGELEPNEDDLEGLGIGPEDTETSEIENAGDTPGIG
jgi:hypothetical protein